MVNNNFHERTALALSFLILNNYLLLILNLPQLIIKINFFIFLLTIFIFYFKNFLENPFLKLSFLFLIFISLGSATFDWDPRSNYLFHAKRIFYDQSVLSVADNYAVFSHNEYPTLVPAFASSLAILIGHWNEVFPKLSFSLVFLPPLIFAYSFFKDTRYLIFLSIVFFTIGNFLFNGWVDGILAMYFCLSAFLMYFLIISNEYKEKSNSFYYLLALCFFITLTLIKNEGTVLLLIIFLATIIIKFFKKKLGNNIAKLILLSFSFIPIILWNLFCYSKGLGHEFLHTDIITNLLSRSEDFNNYKLVSYFLLLNEKFLITLTFFLISCWVKLDKEILSFVFIVSIIYIFILFFVYFTTPHDLYFQLNSTAARVVRSLSFFFAFFGLYNLRHYKKI